MKARAAAGPADGGGRRTRRARGPVRTGSGQAGTAGQADAAGQAGAQEAGALARHTALRGAVTVALRDTAEHPRVFALRGRDPGTLASQLDVIAASAAVLSDAGLGGLARQLAVSAAQADDHPAPLRVALTAASPHQLAGQAEHAARLLRTSAPAAGLAGLPDMRVSAGAGGTVVVLFPGRAESAAGQPALFAASLQALGTLDMLGVRPATGVGYGLGEITGLAWPAACPRPRRRAWWPSAARCCGPAPAGRPRWPASRPTPTWPARLAHRAACTSPPTREPGRTCWRGLPRASAS